MDSKKLRMNSIQFDYFSENFDRFTADFYKYSNLVTPLTFMIDDILFTMSESQVNYFKLPATKSNDSRNHYFIFKVRMQEDNKQVRTYEYVRHALTY